MRKRLAEWPRRWVQRRTTGVIIATIGALFRNAEPIATGAQIRAMPERTVCARPISRPSAMSSAPVERSAAETMKSTPIAMTDWLDRPAKASSGLNYGVYGISNSTSGLGVFGLAVATSGTISVSARTVDQLVEIQFELSVAVVATVQEVVAAAADEGVVARVAIDAISAVAGLDVVVAISARNFVVV